MSKVARKSLPEADDRIAELAKLLNLSPDEVVEWILHNIHILQPRKQQIIQLYIGMGTEPRMSKEEIAQQFEVSITRIRQLLTQSLQTFHDIRISEQYRMPRDRGTADALAIFRKHHLIRVHGLTLNDAGRLSATVSGLVRTIQQESSVEIVTLRDIAHMGRRKLMSEVRFGTNTVNLVQEVLRHYNIVLWE